MTFTIHTGRVITSVCPASEQGWEKASLRDIPDGALVVDSHGRLADVCASDEARSRYPNATWTHHDHCLLLPGFIDTHLHFPQLDIIGCYGEQLLGWLNRYTFPEESRFNDERHAASIATRFVSEMLLNGTTFGCVYSSSHAVAAEALFAECERRGTRAIIGKVGMDRFAPPALLHSVTDDRRANEDLIKRWHGRDGRLFFALTPRFAPSCTPEMLGMYQELAARHKDVFIQTHHSESPAEIAWVAELFPESKNYLDVYDRFGLLGPKTILAHSIHSTPAELERMRETRPIISHCPTSNMFLGSGLIPLESYTSRRVPVALATDIGGGTSPSMWRTMSAAYKIQRLRGHNITPTQLYWLATLAGAQALGMDDRVGSLEKGKDADFLVINPDRHRLLSERFSRPQTAEEAVFSLAILGDDRVTEAVYVRGRAMDLHPAND
jgi:guanine deaminase